MGLSKDTEVCPRLSEDNRGKCLICLICRDRTNNMAGPYTEFKAKKYLRRFKRGKRLENQIP